MTLAEFGQSVLVPVYSVQFSFQSCTYDESIELDAEDSKMNVVWILLSKCLEFNMPKKV